MRSFPTKVAEADLRLTYMFVKYATHLLQGRVDPSEVDAHWFGKQRQADLVARLAAEGDLARADGDVFDETVEGALKRFEKRYGLNEAAWPVPTTSPP